MDPESKDLLEKTFELTKENNKMLHRVRRVQKMQALWSSIKILVVIAVTLGAAYYLQPYFEKAMSAFNQISGMQQSLNNSSLQDILKNIKP